MPRSQSPVKIERPKSVEQILNLPPVVVEPEKKVEVQPPVKKANRNPNLAAFGL